MPQAKKKGEIKYLSTEEVLRLFSKIENIRDYTMFYLIYLYGLRTIEAVNLQTKDIDIARNKIYIEAAKNGQYGFYILTAEIIKILKKYLSWRNKKYPDLQNQVLFPSQKKSKMDRSQIRRLFNKYAKLARIPLDRRHPHVLRHSIAVHMADSGVDVATVQMHLRHKDLRNTMKYFQITSRARDIIQKKALSGEFVAKINR